MGHIRYILCILIITIFSCSNVFALTCSSKEIKDLNTVASHIKASYAVIDKSEEKEIVYENNTKIYSIPNYSCEITM